jgi:DNA repair exonuclease SbcCD ATPase subunit
MESPEVDLSDLSPNEVLSYSPGDHPRVQALDEKIRSLKDDLRDLEAAKQRRKEAEQALHEAQVQRKMGEADESDVQEAKSEFEEAAAAVEQEEATREAIERLKERREEAADAVRRALVDVLARARADALDALVEPFEEALKHVKTARECMEKVEDLRLGRTSRPGDHSRRMAARRRVRNESGPSFSLVDKRDRFKEAEQFLEDRKSQAE